MAFHKGYAPWNKGLSKETSLLVKELSIKAAKSRFGSIPWNKGKKNIFSKEALKKIVASLYGRNNTKNSGIHLVGNRWFITCRDYSSFAYAKALMESHIKRTLSSKELVHHINQNPSDDRIENLQLVTRSEHTAIHNKLRKKKIV